VRKRFSRSWGELCQGAGKAGRRSTPQAKFFNLGKEGGHSQIDKKGKGKKRKTLNPKNRKWEGKGREYQGLVQRVFDEQSRRGRRVEVNLGGGWVIQKNKGLTGKEVPGGGNGKHPCWTMPPPGPMVGKGETNLQGGKIKKGKTILSWLELGTKKSIHQEK